MLEDFRLRIFLTLAQEGSFTKTASVLGVTQPAISQNIAELEKGFGVRLFERLRGEVLLTPAGEIFKEYAENILEQYSEISKVFVPFPPGIVNVCASEESFAYLKEVLLKRFLQVHPEIVLVRSTADSAQITVRPVPIDNKKGILALCSDPSLSFAETDLWKTLSYFLKPTLK